MDCNAAQFYLRFRRPSAADDLDAELAADLDGHLAGCPRCAADAATTTAFDAAVGRAMRAVAVPAGLRNRLIIELSARRGTALRRRAYRVLAVAASVLLAFGVAVGAFTASRPKPDTHALLADHEARTNPDAAQAGVRAWLTAAGLPPDLPEPFDFGQLVFFGSERVQNRDVPVVVFRERFGPGLAKVYVLRSGQFNTKDVPEDQASFWQARVYRGRPGVTYLVLHTGPDLAPFLRGHGAPPG